MTRLGDAAIKHLRKIADIIDKSQPGAADVHATTALGNEGGKQKAKNFLTTIAEIKGGARTVAVPEAPADAQNDLNKSDDDLPWQMPFEIVKTDDDQNLVFGWASVAEINGELVVDKQDDVILPEDLEKAAYDFVLYCREHGDMHVRKGVGRLVESFVFTKQKQDILGIDLGLVGWWVGFFVQDDGVWKRIKAGELPEFSIGGKAVRVPL